MDKRAHDGIGLVGFDADDTLWRSQDYFDEAQAEFERIIRRYVDLHDARAQQHLYDVEKRNIAVFGYGVKGMVLSMIEAAVAITGERISASDVHRIVELGKSLLQHPVELLPGIRDAVEAVASEHDTVLITKGDLFHQEAKVKQSGFAHLFRRIEIVSEKDIVTYARLLEEFDLRADRFVMVGNSLRSDIAPVLALGGWGVHIPYHTTWAHENEAVVAADAPRLRRVEHASGLPAAVREIAALARQ
jgi:putative hydrolase of the HAD superfamily